MIISVDGVIGCGKTTLLQELANRGKLTLPEPVGAWEPYLKDLYESKAPGAAFRMQTAVWLDRCLVPPPATPDVVFLERSPLFQWACFVVGNAASGAISPLERTLLADMYAHTGNRWRPDLYVYLRCDPEKALERVQRRARGPEVQGVTPEYLQQLHRLHESTAEFARTQGVPMLVLDATDVDPAALADEVLRAAREARERRLDLSGAETIAVPEPLVSSLCSALDGEAPPSPGLCKALADELRAFWVIPE